MKTFFAAFSGLLLLASPAFASPTTTAPSKVARSKKRKPRKPVAPVVSEPVAAPEPSAVLAQSDVTAPAAQTPAPAAPATDVAPPVPAQPTDSASAGASGATTTVVAPGKKTTGKVSTVLVNTPEQQAAQTGLLVWTSLEHSVGSGTFVNADYYGSFGSSLLINPTYTFKVGGVSLRATGLQILSMEYLRPVDVPNGRRFSLTDTRLGLSAPVLYKEKFTGIAVTPSLTATLPLSYESRLASTITRLGLNVRLTRSVWKFDFAYALGGSRAFHSNPAAVFTPSGTNRDPQGHLIGLTREGQTASGSNGMNGAYAVANTFFVNLRALEKLTFTFQWDIVNHWTYPAAPVVDEFTSTVVDSNGNPVVRPGWGRADDVTGSLSARYAITEMFALSAGIATVRGPAKTEDNQNLRFPLIDFLGPAENRTSYSFAVEATF